LRRGAVSVLELSLRISIDKRLAPAALRWVAARYSIARDESGEYGPGRRVEGLVALSGAADTLRAPVTSRIFPHLNRGISTFGSVPAARGEFRGKIE